MELNHKILGEGKPFIILHGLFGSLDNWLTVGKQLANEYKVFLLDQRNHGKSSWSDDWDYASMSNDLKEFIETHQLVDPIILGHSMGGKVSMYFAADNPDLLSKLIVVDIAPRYYPVHHQTILEAMNSMDLPKLNSRQEAETEMGKWIEDVSTRQFLLKNLHRNEQNQFEWKVNLKVINEKIENIGDGVPERFTKPVFQKPTLFIRGEESNYIKERDIEDIHSCFSDSKLVTIKGAGHWVHAEQPQKLLEAIVGFLKPI